EPSSAGRPAGGDGAAGTTSEADDPAVAGGTPIPADPPAPAGALSSEPPLNAIATAIPIAAPPPTARPSHRRRAARTPGATSPGASEIVVITEDTPAV